MTLLSVCNDVLGEIGLDPITTVASSTDQRARSILAVAKAAQKKLGRKRWPVLLTYATFDTVAGTAAYDLEADFKAFAVNSAFNEDTMSRLRGAVTPQEWAYTLVNGSFDAVPTFRISGYASKFRLTPTPTAAETLSYWYYSKNLAADSGATEKELAVLDTDVFKFDEDLVKREIKWRYLRQRGLDYGEDYREAAEALEAEFAKAIALPDIMVGKPVYNLPITDGYVPETGFGT